MSVSSVMMVEYNGAWYAVPPAMVENMRAAGLLVVHANELAQRISEATKQRLAQLANGVTKT